MSRAGYKLFLASRMSLSSRKGGAANVGVAIAVTGIALAVVAMMIAIAVMLGFKNEIRAKIMGFDAQLSIIAADPALAVEQSPQVMQIVRPLLPKGTAMVTTARQPVVLKTDSAFMGLVMKGVSGPQPLIQQSVVEGKMPLFDSVAPGDERYAIAISRMTAQKLGAKAGDRIWGYFTAQDGIKTRRLTVDAVFDTHFSDYDRNLSFGSLPLIQEISSAGPETCASIEISGFETDEQIDHAEEILDQALAQAFYDHKTDKLYTVSNVHRTAAVYFNWLSLLDTNIWVLLILLGLVAGFTLISSLFIIVLEKVRLIGLLKALGATNSGIAHTFVLVALRLVVRGLVIGDLLALAFIYAQKLWGVIPLDAESYYLDRVPVLMSWPWFAAINLGVVVVAFLVLLLPARIVSSISPSRVMRFE